MKPRSTSLFFARVPAWTCSLRCLYATVASCARSMRRYSARAVSFLLSAMGGCSAVESGGVVSRGEAVWFDMLSSFAADVLETIFSSLVLIGGRRSGGRARLFVRARAAAMSSLLAYFEMVFGAMVS